MSDVVRPYGEASPSSESHWRAIESDPELTDLLERKRHFIVPATIFFVLYYFALPVLVGYCPDLMATKIVGNINLAYLFAVSEFVMTAVIIYLYVKRADEFDEIADRIKSRAERGAR